ncbi:MAG: class III signal peptide-containing protein [Candidatus Omnitrophica bacterium]|nr:class III signal peptide-containing protein [Candidatus Omnitrophota bacterium]
MGRIKKGQSTLEYIILFAAIVIAVLVLAYKTLQPAVQHVMNASRDVIQNASSAFSSGTE